KVILNQVSGTFRPGRLTAILGPSGSGKTTLLNLLAGQTTKGTTSGNIWINGRLASGSSMRQLAGYVNQEDVILSTQTVEEAIMMSIILRPPPLELGMPTLSLGQFKAQMARCSQAISLFGLEKCRATAAGDSMNKGISGGEKKRTSIAMEWVTDTPIMFLDEPTSGLDAYSALMVTRKLKHITEIGRTVIAVLHQPSSEMFELFDDIVIIFEGRIVYMGERSNLIDYLARIGYPCAIYSNPADHIFNSLLFDMKSEHFGDSDYGNGKQMEQRAKFLSELWQQSEEATALQRRINGPELTPISETQFRRTSPPMVQLRYLLKRTALDNVRNSKLLKLRIVQCIFYGLLIGLVYLNSQNRPVSSRLQNFSGGMFFNCVSQFLVSSLGVINVFTHERKVFSREWQGMYYGLPAYFVAKNIVEQPINIITTVIYCGISYWMIGLDRTMVKFLVYTGAMIVLAISGYSFGILLGASFEELTTIIIALPLVFLPFLLFGGLFVNSTNSAVWIRWLQWVGPIKYGYTAMIKNQFVGYMSDESIGDMYLEELGLGSLSIAANTLINLGLAIFIWSMSYLMLKR
ncbi:P-loop containing nucleoside triphosphate hydrolase protein, partial [Kickxella alabastrina]|uniref:P-loop containing nucleoside triphosphate hydrolase protein n=1 Tax=Kickxella alabastrina TaxID=61397 RepID=UPI0022209690